MRIVTDGARARLSPDSDGHPVAGWRALARVAARRLAAGLGTGTLVFGLLWGGAAHAEGAGKAPGGVGFNQTFIEGLYSSVDIPNPDAVFAHVFSRLRDTITIYPTENYYYFSFTAGSKVIWGNLRLDAVDRDDGVLHIGYFEYDENGKFQDYDGYDKAFTAKDGVVLKKLSRWRYSLTYKGRTVAVRLNDVGMAPPRKGRLRKDEIYVGPVFDESGVKFHLLFNKAVPHLFYMLNEDGAPAETYRKLNEHVVVGRRTGFAYYLDRAQGRKILIGVNGANAQRNNYYDGPFDQLPDNYVARTHIRKYLILAYPELKGRIDKFGHLSDRDDERAAVSAYFTYYDEAELAFVQSCLKTKQKKSAFYACITPDLD